MEQARVTGGGLKVYMTPSTAGTVVATFPDGATVDVEKKVNDLWWRVSFRGKTGYVIRSYLAPVASPKRKQYVSVNLPRETAQTAYKALREALKRGEDQ